MNKMYDDLTRTVEELIRHTLTVSEPISSSENQIRLSIAHRILESWSTGLTTFQQQLTDVVTANVDSEYDRLEELILELSQAIPVIA